MWNYENLHSIQIDISNICNSACGVCSRHNADGSRILRSDLKLTYITLEKFIKFFPEDLIKKVKLWKFCGNNGDAITNPELLKILHYILSINPDVHIRLNTNAGIRSRSFWQELGELFVENKKRSVIFSVDGLQNTNHLYRRNVRWDRVMLAMKTYCDTGARAIWEYLVFKHNEHQIEEAKVLADKLGVSHIVFKKPVRIPADGLSMLDKNGNVEYIINRSEEFSFDSMSC